MDWLLSNWIWIVFGIAMIAMHMFGHGGHTRRDPERANETTGGPPTEHAHADNAVSKATNSDDPARETRRQGPKT